MSVNHIVLDMDIDRLCSHCGEDMLVSDKNRHDIHCLACGCKATIFEWNDFCAECWELFKEEAIDDV